MTLDCDILYLTANHYMLLIGSQAASCDDEGKEASIEHLPSFLWDDRS